MMTTPGTTICRSWFQPQDDDAVVDHLEHQHAEQRAEQRAAAAGEAGAAEDDGGDHGQFEAAAGGRLAGIHQRGEDEAGEPDGQPGDDEGEKLQPLRPHARKAHRLLVGAHRVDVAAERREAQHDIGDRENERGHDDGNRDRPDIAGAEVGEAGHAGDGSAPPRA